ncbi:MAG: sugar nucleotide-binding protein [Nanoarchaeota archaeon]
MKKVFITGEDGMLGREIERQLLLDDNYCLVNSVNSNQFGFKKNVQASYAWKPEIDVTDESGILEAFKISRPDVVIHLAAIVNTDRCLLDLDHAYNVNVNGSYNVAKACKSVGAKLIYFSTTATYDPHGIRPYSEDSLQLPHTFYGATKMAGEHLARTVCDNDILVVRPCFIYGSKRDTSSNIAKMIWAVKNKQSVSLRIDPIYAKDYTFVEDFGCAMKILLDKEVAGTYNITAGNPLGYYDIVSCVEKVLNSKIEVTFECGTEYMFDHTPSNEKLTALGWSPKYSLMEGIKQQAWDIFKGRTDL